MRCPVCFVVMIETNKIRFKRFVRTSHNCNNLTCSWVVFALEGTPCVRAVALRIRRLTHHGDAPYVFMYYGCFCVLEAPYAPWRGRRFCNTKANYVSWRRFCFTKVPYALWGRIAPLSQRLPHASMSSSSR